jgi:hypothetical protein
VPRNKVALIRIPTFAPIKPRANTAHCHVADESCL